MSFVGNWQNEFLEDVKEILEKKLAAKNIHYKLSEVVGGEFSLESDEIMFKDIGFADFDDFDDLMDFVTEDYIVMDDEFKEDRQGMRGVPPMPHAFRVNMYQWVEETKLPKNPDEKERIDALSPSDRHIAIMQIVGRIWEARQRLKFIREFRGS